MSAPIDRPGFRNDVRVIGLIASAHFFSHFFQLTLPPLFPLLKEVWGVPYVALGLAMSVFYGASGVGQTLSGFLVDRVGAPRVLLGGMALFASAIGMARRAAVVEPPPAAHARGVLVVAVHHPAGPVVVHRRLAGLRPRVDEHVHVGLRIVADGGPLHVRDRVAQVLLQELLVVEQLLQVIADLGEPGRDALGLDGGARVGEELIEGVGRVHGRPPWVTAGS